MVELDEESRQLESAASRPSGDIADLDLAALRPVIEARVAEMRTALGGSPERRRTAFRALLGPDVRMRVFPNAEGRFRVEGLFELDLETTIARADHGGSGRWRSVVAGGALHACCVDLPVRIAA